MTGLLIAVEGGEGSGKSTQVARLAQAFPTAVVTRQPGGTEVGAKIRALLLDPASHLDDRTEALLYAADRAQHVAGVIRPALDAGRLVICDRYIDSSIAYQGAGRRADRAWIGNLSWWATRGLVPDLTVLLDVDPEVGLARAARRGAADRIEQEDLGFHRRVRGAFLLLADAAPHRYLVLDATASAGSIGEAIAARVQQLIDTTGATT